MFFTLNVYSNFKYSWILIVFISILFNVYLTNPIVSRPVDGSEGYVSVTLEKHHEENVTLNRIFSKFHSNRFAEWGAQLRSRWQIGKRKYKIWQNSKLEKITWKMRGSQGGFWVMTQMNQWIVFRIRSLYRSV